MTGVELSAFYCIYVGHCEYFGCQHSDLPCFVCAHDTAWQMYLLGLNMLETGNNPFDTAWQMYLLGLNMLETGNNPLI